MIIGLIIMESLIQGWGDLAIFLIAFFGGFITRMWIEEKRNNRE